MVNIPLLNKMHFIWLIPHVFSHFMSIYLFLKKLLYVIQGSRFVKPLQSSMSGLSAIYPSSVLLRFTFKTSTLPPYYNIHFSVVKE